MNQMFVKICGLTRNEDARMAQRLGANALGLIFAKSTRRVTISQAREVLHGIDSEVERIGVFADASLEAIRRAVDRLGLTGVQLHGQESAEFLTRLKDMRPQLKIIKTVKVERTGTLTPLKDMPCDVLLFDSAKGSDVVGPLPLDLVTAQIQEGVDRPYLIAGGLNASNVSRYIRLLKPQGVDVSSGVESRPGIKSGSAMVSFFSSVYGSQP